MTTIPKKLTMSDLIAGVCKVLVASSGLVEEAEKPAAEEVKKNEESIPTEGEEVK